MKTFETLESEVRGYCRSFPTVFETAQGWEMYDEAGRRYLDFFAGAGALNYGHNDPRMQKALIAYIQKNGVTHSLDMMTTAKRRFLQRFDDVIMKPRGLSYKVQFPGPTGTNAVEAALKLARKVTGRHGIVSFTNAFHGMTLGSLAVTGNSFKRHGAGVPLANSTVMPYCNYFEDELDSLSYFEAMLADGGSGVDKPAAVILETLQGEGGLNTASMSWLKRLRELTARHDILLIVDDIQVGCGRTGPFFSFEPSGIAPDIITLSKSLSGMGLPLAVTLIRPDIDVWDPGEHNGTFRGNNHAFITATEALSYWETDALQTEIEAKGEVVRRELTAMVEAFPQLEGELRGRGLMQGIAFADDGVAGAISKAAFERGLIMETAGANDEVAKLMPPLVISETALLEGLDIMRDAVREVATTRRKSASNGKDHSAVVELT